MSHRCFEGKLHAEIYNKYRPTPPNLLIERFIAFAKEKSENLNFAIDVGCGTGQVTNILSPYFKRVIGQDVSESQIQVAASNCNFPNVEYKVSGAEKLIAGDNEVQLITASAAAHWFDLPKFYKECRRVLSIGGVLAIFCYDFPSLIFGNNNEELTENLKKIINELFFGHLNNSWAPPVKMSQDAKFLENYPIPLQDFTREVSFYNEKEMNVADFMMYCRTFSGFQTFCREAGDEEGEKIIKNIEKRIMETLNVSTCPENTSIVLRHNFYLVMARK